jgi:hypothetical protein
MIPKLPKGYKVGSSCSARTKLTPFWLGIGTFAKLGWAEPPHRPMPWPSMGCTARAAHPPACYVGCAAMNPTYLRKYSFSGQLPEDFFQ